MGGIIAAGKPPHTEKMEFNARMEIAAWLGCLAFALMLFNEGAKLADRSGARRRIRPTNNWNSASRRLTGGSAGWRRNHQRIWTKMEADKTEILLAGELRAEKLHNRINPIAEGMEGLKSAVDLNNQQTVLLSTKLDRLMEGRKSDIPTSPSLKPRRTSKKNTTNEFGQDGANGMERKIIPTGPWTSPSCQTTYECTTTGSVSGDSAAGFQGVGGMRFEA